MLELYLVDYDKRFQAFLSEWLDENRDNYENIDEMEDVVPDLYEKWLNTPAQWLGGYTPDTYFYQYNDSEMLVKLMLRYMASETGLPEPLLDRIFELKGEAVKPLMAIIRGEADMPAGIDKNAATIIAINILVETGEINIDQDFVDRLSEKDLDRDLADVLIETLSCAENDVIDKVFNALERTQDQNIKIRYAHVLSGFNDDDRIFELIKDLFIESDENRAVMASYLGKYGDPKAVGILKKALDWQQINYLDYIEIRNALEELGQEVSHTRDFEGDKYYESLKGLD